MKMLLCLLLAVLLIVPATDAASARARHHVVIHKFPPPRPSTQPVAIPLAAVPPLLVFYDLQRRTSCDGDVLGLGGPGFDASGPQTGNFLIPATVRGDCVATPRRHRRG